MKWEKMKNKKKVFSAFHRNTGIFFSVSGVFSGFGLLKLRYIPIEPF